MNNVYDVFDYKMNAFRRELVAIETDGAMVRMFSDAVLSQKSYLSKHPGDYALFHIGTYDEEVGRIDFVIPNRLVCRAADFVNVDSKVEVSND